MMTWNEMDMTNANIPNEALETAIKLWQQSTLRQFSMKMQPEVEHVRTAILSVGWYELQELMLQLIHKGNHILPHLHLYLRHRLKHPPLPLVSFLLIHQSYYNKLFKLFMLQVLVRSILIILGF